MEKIRVHLVRIVKQCLFSIVLAGIILWFYGKAELVMGVFVGEVIGLACIFIMGWRILKSADFDVGAAVRNMQIGWVIRLFFILGCLAAVIQISVPLFWAVVAGFFFAEFIMMANAVYAMLRKNADNQK